MTKDMSNKDIITLYAMHVRWVSSGIDSLKPITLLSDKEVALIEEAIKASACSLSPLQRAALQGRIGGLTNEQIAKATGYSAAYVWGGSSPATSFDCSGFVSWVINHSGWNVGRLGAQGLYNICTPTSSPKPGDLVFFVGTYDTAGVSHCGIYVGDGMMIHCGDPIQYANLNTSYWQSHFYAYGRLL